MAQLDDDTVYFFHAESGDIRQVDNYKGLVVLGECGLANAQSILDDMHGGLARIACNRLQEVA